MKNIPVLRRAAAALTVVIAAAALLHAASDEISLFDDKTLTGWTMASGKPITKGWEVVDGTIHRTSAAGDIVTARTFSDFALTFEFKAAPGTNSGVKYRFGKYGNERIGMEYQILSEPKAKPDARPNIHTTAALYDLLAPAVPEKPVSPTEWNTGKIVAQGGHIEHWLNGQKMLTVTLGSPEWKAMLQKSKFRKELDFGTKPGPILLQEHGGEVWFRNLHLTELKPEKVG